jgi:hypothetical protein
MAKTTFKSPPKKEAKPATSSGLPKPTFGGAKKTIAEQPELPEQPTKKSSFGAKKTAEPTAPPKVKFGATKKTEVTDTTDSGPNKDLGDKTPNAEAKGTQQYSAPTDRRLSTHVHDDVQGEVGSSDLVMPSLKLVQSIGPMSELFDAGIFILNGETPISNAGPVAEGGSSLRISMVKCLKKYQENVEWGSEETAKTFNTLEEVVAAGGHCDWIDNQKPPYSPIALALVGILCPADDVVDSFPFEHEGQQFALAAWTMKGSAYTRGAKPVFTAAEFSLKGMPLATGAWDLSSKRVNINGNLIWVPILKRVGVWDEPTVEFLRSCV